jgi:hypothetical protein
MNIRALLIAWVVALAIVPAVSAEDAVVADDPLQIPGVGACDAYGPGCSQIAGTSTCIKVSGQLRYEKHISSGKRSSADGSTGRVILDLETRTD